MESEVNSQEEDMYVTSEKDKRKDEIVVEVLENIEKMRKLNKELEEDMKGGFFYFLLFRRENEDEDAVAPFYIPKVNISPKCVLMKSQEGMSSFRLSFEKGFIDSDSGKKEEEEEEEEEEGEEILETKSSSLIERRDLILNPEQIARKNSADFLKSKSVLSKSWETKLKESNPLYWFGSLRVHGYLSQAQKKFIESLKIIIKISEIRIRIKLLMDEFENK